MPLTPDQIAALQTLKTALQALSPSRFEHLAARLVEARVGVRLSVAKAGFQHGADAGTAGRAGRSLRVEAKRYGDDTRLSERELLGEIDHALARDPALECWILAATRPVDEQLANALRAKSEKEGLPVVTIDWEDGAVGALAALCAAAPDIVVEFDPAAGAAAAELAGAADEAIERLDRELTEWHLGFEALRDATHERVRNIWTDRRAALSQMQQNVAGGAEGARFVERRAVSEALSRWWAEGGEAPAALVGLEGVGKTWATMAWLAGSLDTQPLLVVLPASAFGPSDRLGEPEVMALLGAELRRIAGTRDRNHWEARLGRLLKRPLEEGPVLTLVLDGVNQRPSVAWLDILRTLQDEPFAGRVRVILTTRPSHHETHLQALSGRALAVAGQRVDVGGYDDDELDAMLAKHGLSRADLSGDLIVLARTPRLFVLVVDLRDALRHAGPVTVHRLLYEYGRKTLGPREGAVLDPGDWRIWLEDVARTRREAILPRSRDLARLLGSPTLDPDAVSARLSEIVDGAFARADRDGRVTYAPALVAHALATGLLEHLEHVDAADADAVGAALDAWLDPIAGLDERAEVLRAATSILVATGAARGPIADAIVTAWLQSQNLPDGHIEEVIALGPCLVEPLLAAIERSPEHAAQTARAVAVAALRKMPRDRADAREAIVARMRVWAGTVSRKIQMRHERDETHAEKAIRERIGMTEAGEKPVLGVALRIIDDFDTCGHLVPLLLEGYPVADAVAVFEAAAVAEAVEDSEAWKGLKWLVALEDGDGHERTKAALNACAEALARGIAGDGIAPDLAQHAASLVLCAAEDDELEAKGSDIDPRRERTNAYRQYYLENPSRAFFPIELRHANAFLSQSDVDVLSRAERAGRLLASPDYAPPAEFTAALRAKLAGYSGDDLHRHMSPSIEEHRFEIAEVALARCAPDLLAEIHRRRMEGFARRDGEARYWTAIHALDALVLVDEDARTAARALRERHRHPGKVEEAFASTQLLSLELVGRPGYEQVEAILGAGLSAISHSFGAILAPVDPAHGAALVTTRESKTSQQHLLYLLRFSGPDADETIVTWAIGLASDPDWEGRFEAYCYLTSVAAERFGTDLIASNWTWAPAMNMWLAHYGSLAVAAASRGAPFSTLRDRVAPWTLLRAARDRGGDPEEIRQAAAPLAVLLAGVDTDPFDLGAEASVWLERSGDGPHYLSVSPRDDWDGVITTAEQARRAFDMEARRQEQERAWSHYFDRLEEARAAGAVLLHAPFAADDLAPAVRYAWDIVERWLDGADARSPAFVARVRRAEHLFLALCAALLAERPADGTRLWRALRGTLVTRFTGAAGIDELVHIAMRAPPSAEANALRDGLLDLPLTNTDKALHDLCLAAELAGRRDWLDAVIARDEAAGTPLGRERASVMRGFTCGATLPVPGAWPEGEQRLWRERRATIEAQSRHDEACARHWWNAYVDAPNAEEAYAAWVLFVACADRRAHLAVQRRPIPDEAPLATLKRAHLAANRRTLEKAMEKREKDCARRFLRRDIVRGIGPWAGNLIDPTH